MRDIKDRPRYMSQWTIKELLDGCSRAPSLLAEYGFDRRQMYAALQKRGAKHANLVAERRHTKAARLACREEAQVRCGNLKVDGWKAELPILAKHIAGLKASPYQACWKSVKRVTDNIRHGILTRGQPPGLEATAVSAFWAFVAGHRGDHAADVAMAKLRMNVDECREQRLEGRRYNIR